MKAYVPGSMRGKEWVGEDDGLRVEEDQPRSHGEVRRTGLARIDRRRSLCIR
jgi:hypothetical protein